METTGRRTFIKTGALAAAYVGAAGFSARSYAAIRGANERVRVGVVGFADRFRSSLMPAFVEHAKELNFDFVAVSDIWNRRRDEGQAALAKAVGHDIEACRNNEELYERVKDLDAVFIATADFQHAMHTIEAVRAGKDVYSEKPLAETMADARAVVQAVRATRHIVQIGSQRRSGVNYQAASRFIQEGKFGPLVAVELVWNVNQPGRWRRPQLVEGLKESDVDWKRFLLNRPAEAFDARKYVEYRLFWPYSSGIPGQWMCHQIDTVHWFTGLTYPRSVVANGGIYQWRDGRTNADTMTAVMDYGPEDRAKGGFQVVFSSRQNNSAGGTREVYRSNGGSIDLDTGMVTPEGGLTEEYAKVMGVAPNLLPKLKLAEAVVAAAGANTGNDPLTSAHVRNWMECVRSRKEPNAPIEAGFWHSVACIMTNAAYRTGERVVFDPKSQEVLAGGKVFQY
jgi:predicted dehydrogenase